MSFDSQLFFKTRPAIRRAFTLIILCFALLPNTVFAKDAPVQALNVCMISSDLFPLWRKPGAEHETFGGINIDLMREVVKPMNLKLNWIRAPFARCLHFLQTGHVDVLNVASYTPQREVYGVYPKVNGKIDVSRRFKFDTYYAFVMEKSDVSFNGENFSLLNDVPVAVEIKASIIPRLQEMGLELLQQPQAEFSFLMLEKGRVSAVITNQYNGLKYMREGIKRLQPAVQEKPYYLVFSRKFYQKHLDKVERMWFLSGQIQSHVYQQVLQRYTSMPHWPQN